MPITFQAARLADLAELLILTKELQKDDPWSCPFEEAVASRVTADLLSDLSLGRTWLICDGPARIGYIAMAFDYSLEYRGRGAWVDEFFVRPAYRGQGIGTQALAFFVQQAQELGATVIHLEVNHGNPAIELYRRLAFEDHPRYLMTRWVIPKP